MKTVRAVPILLLTWCCLAQFALGGKVLSERDKLALQRELAPVARNGDLMGLLRILVPISSRLEGDAVGEVDEVLRNVNLPPLAEMLLGARLELISDPAIAQRLPAPSPRESVLLLSAIHRRVVADTQEIEARRREMAAKLPADFLDYGRWQQRTYMLQRQLQTTTSLAAYADSVAGNKRRLPRRDVTDDQQAAIEFDFAAATEQLRALSSELEIAERRQRADRLRDLESVLRLSTDPDERFNAACSLADDLLRFPRAKAAPRQAAGKASSGKSAGKEDADAADATRRRQLAEIDELTARAGEAAGERLRFQAERFVVGLYWWNRGRYGQGMLGNGALKPEAAKRSPAALVSLQMPLEPPVPVAPRRAADQSPDPTTDRRHHYAWNWENRQIYVSESSSQSEQTLESQTSKTTLWRVRFTAAQVAS